MLSATTAVIMAARMQPAIIDALIAGVPQACPGSAVQDSRNGSSSNCSVPAFNGKQATRRCFPFKNHFLRLGTLGAAGLDLDRRMVDTKVLTHLLGYAGQKRVRAGVRHDEVDGQCRIGGADSPDVQIVHVGDALEPAEV